MEHEKCVQILKPLGEERNKGKCINESNKSSNKDDDDGKSLSVSHADVITDDDDGYDSGMASADTKNGSSSDGSNNNSSDSINKSEGAHNPNLDGGYGWVIIIASFFNAFIIDGIGSCFGLLFPYVVDKFQTSAFVASFAGSLFVALLIMGSISAELVRRFGFRTVSIAGGILSCVAFVASAFSSNIVVFILTYGLMAGCSCGLVFLPSIVIVNGYFHEKRGLANGIISSGSGAGLLSLAPFINFLLERYQLEGTILILAGVLLNMCVFSSLYRPPDLGNSSSHTVKPENGDADNLTTEDNAHWLKDDGVESWEADFADVCQVSLTVSNESLSRAHSKPSLNGGAKHKSVSARRGSSHGRDPKSALGFIQARLLSKSKSHQASLFPLFHFGSQKKLDRSEHKGMDRVQWRSENHVNHDPHSSTHSGGPSRLQHSVHCLPTWVQHKQHVFNTRSSENHHHLSSTDHSSSRHHHHRSHNSHSFTLPPDHGSNLYLAGSISTLKNLHHRHLLHASQSSALHTHDYDPCTIAIHNHNDESKSTYPASFDKGENSRTDSTQHLYHQLKKSHLSINTHSSVQSVSNLSTKDGLRAKKNALTQNLLRTHDKHSPHNGSQLIMPPVLFHVTDHHGSNPSIVEPHHISIESVDVTDPCLVKSDDEEPVPVSGFTTKQLLRLPSFYLFCLGASFIQFGYPIAGTFLADYAYQYGLTTSHSAILMILLGSSNIVGRLLAGALANARLDPLLLNNLSLLLGGVVCVMSPLYTEFWSLGMLAALFGFFLGFFPPLQPLVLVEYFGLDSLVSAFGFLTTIKGLANVLGVPIAGWIYDASGTYAWSFVFAGACFLASAVVHYLMTLARPKLPSTGR